MITKEKNRTFFFTNVMYFVTRYFKNDIVPTFGYYYVLNIWMTIIGYFFLSREYYVLKYVQNYVGNGNWTISFTKRIKHVGNRKLIDFLEAISIQVKGIRIRNSGINLVPKTKRIRKPIVLKINEIFVHELLARHYCSFLLKALLMYHDRDFLSFLSCFN